MDNVRLLLHDELDGSPPADTPPTRDNAIQQRVHELDSQAQSYLARPTNANFKQAIGLYERILGFGDINPAQRVSFEKRLEETLHAYEQFRAQFGELTTARQIQPPHAVHRDDTGGRGVGVNCRCVKMAIKLTD